MTEIKYILMYYAVLSAILFILMGADKYKAVKHKWRVRERVLFAFALLGGFLGGYAGMVVFHHKIRKPLFYIIYTLGLIIHIAAIIYIFRNS